MEQVEKIKIKGNYWNEKTVEVECHRRDSQILHGNWQIRRNTAPNVVIA